MSPAKVKGKCDPLKLNDAELDFVKQNLEGYDCMPTRKALLGQVNSLFKS